MAIDPSIALAVRPVQLPVPNIQSPVDQLAQVLSLRNLMTQGQLGQIGLQSKQLELDQLRLQAQKRANIANLIAQGLTQPPAAPVIAPPPAGAPMPSAAAPVPNAGPGAPGDFAPVPGTAPTFPSGFTRLPDAATPPASAPGAPLATLMTQPQTAPAVTAPAVSGPAASPAAPGPALVAAPMADPFAGLPSTADLIRVGGDEGMALADNIQKTRKAYYENVDAAHKADIAHISDLATIASTVHDEPTKFSAIAEADKRKLITPEVRDQLLNHPYNKQEWDGFGTQALDEAKRREEARAAVNQQALEEQQAHERAMRPFQEATAAAQATEAGTKAQVSQRAADAQTLAPLLAKNDGGAAFQAQIATMTPERAAPFADAKTSQEVMQRALNPEQYVTAEHQNRQQLIDAAKYRIEKQKADAEFGPGTAESLAAQVYANPDSANDVKGGILPKVIQVFRDKYKLPFPTPLKGQALDQETASKNTLGDVDWIRNALKNPNIANNIGPILGRIQNVEQSVGEATGLTGADAQMAQEFRTRMRMLLANEAGTMRARINPKMMDDLEKSSGNIKMDSQMLSGALDGVAGYANQKLTGLERQRFGGQTRTPEARGITAPLAPPKSGDTLPAKDGKTYRFKGGDPNVKSNWEPI